MKLNLLGIKLSAEKCCLCLHVALMMYTTVYPSTSKFSCQGIKGVKTRWDVGKAGATVFSVLLCSLTPFAVSHCTVFCPEASGFHFMLWPPCFPASSNSTFLQQPNVNLSSLSECGAVLCQNVSDGNHINGPRKQMCSYVLCFSGKLWANAGSCWWIEKSNGED